MMLTKILRPECVKVPLRSTDKQAVITELVDLLHSEGLFTDRDAVLEAVRLRESIRSTAIGSGIAIPHGKSTALKELAMGIGIARPPIEFDSVDGKPVITVILLVSPPDQLGPHIQALAKISRLMLDPEFKTALEQAPTAEQAYELISRREGFS